MPELEGEEEFRRLSDFIRASQDTLVAEWTERIRTMSPAKELSRRVLVDHLPEILARIANMVEPVHTGAPASLSEAPKQHAIDRLAVGFDLEEVIKEYSVLRQCLLTLWQRNVGATITVSEQRRLEAALDQSITDSVVSFARARERMLRALDRISEAALGSAKLDVFLQKLLQATLETTEAVDTAAVLLREGDFLTTRAAVGIEEEVQRGFTERVGEGFAGKIAAEAQPLVLRHALDDPRVRSQALRDKGVRALYGVPLSHGGSVIGVAYMGSRTAFEFSEEDKLLFRTMASRATSVIVQAQLVTNLEKTIADRDRLVWQLAGARARLEQILNQIPAGVLIADASSGEISFVNKRTRDLLGGSQSVSLPAAEYPGWHLFSLDGRPYAPEETPRYRALRGEDVVDEFKVKRPDGSWMTVRATAAPVRDPEGRIQSAVVTFDDVTAQKRYEETLRFLSEASRELAESIDYEATLAQVARFAVPGIADWFSVDMLSDGEIRPLFVAHGDPAKMELAREFRRRFPPHLGAPRGVAKVLREGQPELFEDISDERLAAGAQSAEHLGMMRKLDMRSAMVVPLHVRGRTVGAISFVTTGSGRRYDRRDLEVAQGFADRAAVAIENARLFRDAERAIRLREQVLAVVSHDLRNPLTSINMSATILSKKLAANAPARRQVEAVERAARRMDRLIGDLLDTASIHAGRLAIEPSPQELVPIIHEAIQLAEPLARERGLELSSEISLDEVRCNVDRERVLQLFSNLFGNAIKFCPPDSIIKVRARVIGNEVECCVSDTGPGIPETDLPHIFDPYWSAKRHAKNGTGLGLFISKGIVETHGGRIWAQSRPGEGATFRFTLPLA